MQSPNFQPGIYNFPKTTTTLYVCSDFEGGNVFNFDNTDEVYDIKINKKKKSISAIEGQDMVNILNNKPVPEVCPTKNEVMTELIEHFEISNNILAQITGFKGIITDIKNPNVALAYTGDLFDQRPHSLRLLKAMIHLKDTYTDRVIIIGGNRDFNKLRLGIEFFVVNKNNTNLFSIPNTDLNKLLDSDLIFRDNSVINIEEGDNDVHYLPNVIRQKIKDKCTSAENYKLFHNRVEFTFKESMGANYLAYKKELLELFPHVLPEPNNDEQICKLLCILFTVMSFEYGEENLPAELIPWNGLLFKYFKYTHPIAYFKINDKTGVLSHSGIPIDAYNKAFLSIPFGSQPPDSASQPTDSASLTLEEAIIRMNTDVRSIIDTEFPKILDDEQIEPSLKNLLKAVGFGEKGADPTFVKNTPVVGGPSGTPNRFAPIYIGGDRPGSGFAKNLWKSKSALDYNIFGHKPGPFFPVTLIKGKTNYISLDVCKNDGGDIFQNNNYSFAMLKISAGGDKLFGRSLFGKNTDSKNQLASFENKILYYNKPLLFFTNITNNIEDNKSKYYPLVLNLNEMDLDDKYKKSVKFRLDSGPPFKRIITEVDEDVEMREQMMRLAMTAATAARAGGGGKFKKRKYTKKRKSRHKKRATHKKKKTGKQKRHQHKCTALCKKCHKHDHKCMLRCGLCHKKKTLKSKNKI
jgi:hypothetical protein